MKKKKIFVLMLLFIPIFLSACDKTYSGKVIDADTKEPIEGAVVVATWLEETATVAGPSERFKDVKETLTDKNGEWFIKGPRGQKGGNITAIYTFITGGYYTRRPGFIVFKPGYCSWPQGYLYIDVCREKLKVEGNSKIGEGKTVELPKLTNREDRLRALPGPDNRETYKLREFMRLINEERKKMD